MKLAVFTDEITAKGGWHGQVLGKAFEKRGYQARFVSLQDCVIDLGSDMPQIKVPSFDGLPQAAFIRGIAGGTLQQVVIRLNILHILQLCGVIVYNDAKAIERAVDKAMTSFLLKQADILTPSTWVTESRAKAHAIIERETQQNRQLVIKPLFGSQGKGVRYLDKNALLPLPGDKFVDNVFYLQQYIDSGASNYDFRVFVINHKPVAAMRRNGNTWLNNVAQGARCELIDNNEVLNLASRVSKVIDIDYCGIDIMRSQTGKLYVIEVNSMPAWRGLQTIAHVDIAQCLVDDVLSKAGDV